MPYRSRPTNEQLSFLNKLYQERCHAFKTLLHDALTGLDLIGHLVASIQISRPSRDFDKVIDAIDALTKSIHSREEESGLLRPTEEAIKNPFEAGTVA